MQAVDLVVSVPCCVADQMYLWGNSQLVKELVRKMMVKDPRGRITATEARDHSWFTDIKRAAPMEATVVSASAPVADAHVMHGGTRLACGSPLTVQ